MSARHHSQTLSVATRGRGTTDITREVQRVVGGRRGLDEVDAHERTVQLERTSGHAVPAGIPLRREERLFDVTVVPRPHERALTERLVGGEGERDP